MKKNILILVIFLSIISLFMIKIQNPEISAEKTLETAFTASGARIVSSEIYFTAKSDQSRFKSAEDMKKLAVSLAEAFGIKNAEALMTGIENEGTSGIELNFAEDSFRNVNIKAARDKTGGGDGKCYIDISMVDTSEAPALEETERKVNAVLKGHQLDAGVNSCITGNFTGKLGDNELNKICRSIFESANARKVEGIRENSLISVSAYTPDIGRSIDVNGSRINLNIAIRYNSYEDKTYIWLATPVITTEY